MSKPLISIIVPLYNYKKYIKDCIKSIIKQTYTNYELIIVDDCSTDNSYNIVKKMEKKYSRIKVIRLKKNSGYSKAKNEGIVLSKGEFITTLDADDMLTKNSLSLRMKTMLKTGVQFVHADAITVKGDITLKECYKIKRVPDFNKKENLNDIHAQAFLIKREVFKKYGLYDENLRSRSDRELWWRLFGFGGTGPYRISSYFLNRYVVYYRHHKKSMWRKRKRNKILDATIIKQSEKACKMRLKEGINQNNTRFLEK